MQRNSEKKQKQPVQAANLLDVIEVCKNKNGTPTFLVQANGVLVAEPSLTIDGAEYVPPTLAAMPWLLPNAEQVANYYATDSDNQLFNDIERAIRENSELPNDLLYPFLAAWVLHTHLADKCTYSPIVTFYAVAARGKTRTCRTLLYMTRRGVHAESIREADIIRKSQRFGCTFVFDIMDVWKKAERLGAEDILLSRFERGITVARVTRPEANGFDDTQHFTCFGPTLISTNEPAHRILDSRGVIITMKQANRQFETDLTEADLLSLRERATAFRARWLQRELPEIKKPARDRLGDILKPIAQILTAVAPERLPEFYDLVKVFADDRTEALAETPEGQIVRTVIGLEDQVIGGRLETRLVVDAINLGKSEKYHTTATSVGKRLTALGLNTTRIGNSRAIVYDRKLVERLALQYGHQCEEGDQPGKPDVMLPDMPDVPGFKGIGLDVE